MLFLLARLFLDDSAELTGCHAGSALDALGLIDLVLLLDGAADAVHRALAGAGRTAAAGIGDLVVQQSLAVMRRAALFPDVRFVLVTEILDRGEHGVRSRLAQTAQGAVLDAQPAPAASRCRLPRPCPG